MSDSLDLDSVFQVSLECLERGESIQDCLARYPERAAELAPLLETVVALRSLASPPPRSEAARAAARVQFLSAVERRQAQMVAQTQTAWPRWRERLSQLLRHPLLRQWAPVLGGVLLAFLLISGTMRASATSLPGDLLYPIKLATEQVQLLITGDTSQRTTLQEKFQERRRTEAKTVIEQGRRARVNFSGVIERVTPGALQVAGLTVRLGYETRIQGAPRVGAIAQVTAVSQSFGELVALDIEVFEPPTPTPMPTVALTATPAPQPTRARATRPRVQIPQRRTRTSPVIIPTRPPTPVLPTPTPLPTAAAPTPEGPAVTATALPLPEEVLTVTPGPTDGRALPTPVPTAVTPELTVTGPAETPATPSEATPVPTATEPAETPTAQLAPEASPTSPPPEATPEPAPTTASTPPPSEPTATPVPEAPTPAAPPPTATPPPPTEPPPAPTPAPPPPPSPEPNPGKELPTPSPENPAG